VRKKKRIWKIWGKVFKIRVFPLKTRKPSFLRDAQVSSARRAYARGYTGFSKFMLRDAWKCRRDAQMPEAILAFQNSCCATRGNVGATRHYLRIFPVC
jgi:hypothetical protein